MMRKELVSGLGLVAITVALTLASGCSSGSSNDPSATAGNEERERLRAENQELAQARTENEEVQRLKKENQDLAKLRSQYQEAVRIKKDNDQLKQQIARISPAAAAAQAAAAAKAQAAAAGALARAPGDQAGGTNALDVVINEGDDVLLEPKDIKQLLPDFDWEKLGRKEPISVKALLERDGLQLTNAAQLKELGLTNYVIQRALASTNQPPQ